MKERKKKEGKPGRKHKMREFVYRLKKSILNFNLFHDYQR